MCKLCTCDALLHCWHFEIWDAVLFLWVLWLSMRQYDLMDAECVHYHFHFEITNYGAAAVYEF